MAFRPARLSLLLAALAGPAAAQEPPAAVPVEEPGLQPVAPGANVPQPEAAGTSTSRSGMFRVRGGEQSQRSSVALALEQIKGDFESLIRDKNLDAEKQAAKKAAFFEPGKKSDEFKVPVDVVLTGAGDGPSVEYSLRFTEDTFLLGLRIRLERGVDNDQLERAALTVLLYERALRGVKPGELADPLVVRPWLVEGLIEAWKWRDNRADRRLYEGVFKRGGGFTLDELFELPEKNFNQLDGVSRLSFRVLSGALVMALLEQPDGREGFRNFCGEAARFSGEMQILLRRHFPELTLSERSLAKWWALSLAKLVAPKLSEVLPIPETERELTEALQFHSRDADGNAINQGIEAWQTLADLKPAERAEAARPAEDSLNRLSYRCFPSYRSLLEDYQAILRDFVQGKHGDLDARLQELTGQRQLRIGRANRARDYMDFVEISQAREISGEFDDYLRLKKELELRPRPKRTDTLSNALDTLQRAYEPRKKR
jgi:hypothetical protein